MGHISLIAKATRLCNLRCTYCHDWRAETKERMNFPTLANMTFNALTDEMHDTVEFIWHGGEPTLLPISFYEKALLIQSRFRRPGQTVLNLIQTNGTNLSNSWIQFLKKYRFIVGISLDGPPEVHDLYRKYASGRPSFRDVIQTIKILQKNSLPVSVLMVIDEKALLVDPRAIFDFFIKAGIKYYGLLPATPLNYPAAAPGTMTSHYVNPITMNIFLIKLYDCWKEYGDYNIHIREFDSIIERIRGRRTGDCTLEGNCFGKYYMIEPNGDISHCDLFLGDARYSLGNVMTTSFKEVRTDSKLIGLKKEYDNIQDKMKICPGFSICNGWCPHERYLSVRHNDLHKDDCCGLLNLITHIRENMPN